MWKVIILIASCLIGLNTAFLDLTKPIFDAFDNALLLKTPPQITWSGGEFVWPADAIKKMYKSSGKYKSKNVIATRGQIHDNEVYLALPRLRSGVPATLVRMSLSIDGSEPYYEPFPSWELQEEGNCDALQSVVDVYLDSNHILWVLDTGIVNTLEKPIRHCGPKIVAISLKTGVILKKISLSDFITDCSRLQYLVVDHSHDGRVFIYVSDAANRAIIVYDVLASRGYRIILPEALVIGCSKHDVLYLMLAKHAKKSSVLYFTYLGSTNLFAIETKYLQTGHCIGNIIDIGHKPKKMVFIGTDNGYGLFFRYEGQNEVYGWDTLKDFDVSHFKSVHKPPPCQLATHAMADYKFKKMRVLESNFPDYIHGYIGCGAVQHISLMESYTY